jgi:hypothetical protein
VMTALRLISRAMSGTIITNENAYVQLDQDQPPRSIDIRNNVTRITSTETEANGKTSHRKVELGRSQRGFTI